MASVSRISDATVDEVLGAFLERGGINVNRCASAMRTALEAVWPEPPFTQEELEELLRLVVRSYRRDDDLRDKLEIMLGEAIGV